ncbi:6-pyruvoyl tetrahydropterin synthase family protein [Candidatus Margulisiibacteriota bacterium]
MLTINKLFRFSASHRCYNPVWTDARNLEAFGKEATGKFGHGHNFGAAFVLTGPVDSKTGMIMEFSQIKYKINMAIIDKYDHKFINEVEPFDKTVPTQENISAHFLQEASELFHKEPAQVVACHIISSPERSATSYQDRDTESHWQEDLFLSGNLGYLISEGVDLGAVLYPFKLLVTLNVGKDLFLEHSYQKTLKDLLRQVTAKKIGDSIDSGLGLISKYCYDLFKKHLPVVRIKLSFADMFAEYFGSGETVFGREDYFYAMHKLGNGFSEEEKTRYYGKCRFLHGHSFRVETSIKQGLGNIKAEAEAVKGLKNVMSGLVQDWDHKYLEQETADFKNRISTGEEIVQVLRTKILKSLPADLYRLRLWETENNRFCWREA